MNDPSNEASPPPPINTAALAGVIPVPQWLELPDVKPVFANKGAWEWFRYSHLHELVERGGLLLGAGRRADMATAELAAIVREILLRLSIERLQRHPGTVMSPARSVAAIAATAQPQAQPRAAVQKN